MAPHRPDRTELARSRRRWNFWSRHWAFVERDSAGIRRETVELAALSLGDTVLDLGCGPGVNFEMLRAAVGPDGRVVGVDLSDGMVARARDRVVENGWENVVVVQADGTWLPVASGSVDSAVATTALVAMPDMAAAASGVYDALRPGGRFAVYELQLVPAGPARLLNPLLDRFFRLFGDWNAEEHALDVLASVFGSVTVQSSYALGTNVVAVSEKSDAG